MNYLIVTNNNLVAKQHKNIRFVTGTVDSVLTEARDLLHRGYGLISHPLPASLKLFYSPYRSILMKAGYGNPDAFQVEVMENSIRLHRKHLEERGTDCRHDGDYQYLDLELLKAYDSLISGGEAHEVGIG